MRLWEWDGTSMTGRHRKVSLTAMSREVGGDGWVVLWCAAFARG